MCTGTCKIDDSPRSTSLENIPKSALVHPGWHQRKGQIKQRSWWYGTKSIWDAIRSAPGASPPCLNGRVRKAEGTCVVKGQTKSDQGRDALVEGLSTPPSRAGRERLRWKEAMAVDASFFSLTDGS